MLYNGEQRWNASGNIKDLIVEVQGGLSRYCPSMNYYLIDEGSYDEAKLSSLKNLVAAMIRLENGVKLEMILFFRHQNPCNALNFQLSFQWVLYGTHNNNQTTAINKVIINGRSYAQCKILVILPD